MAYSYGPSIIKNGLAFAYDAANRKSYPGSGTVWSDLSGNNVTGTLTNGPTFSSANGGVIVFDGVNDYVNLTRPATITTGGSLTISMYAKWVTVGTTVSTIQALIDNNHSAPNIGFIIQDRPDLNQRLTFSVRPSTTTQVSSSFVVGNGNWYHITGTNDGTTSRLYINGVLDGFVTEAGGLSTVQTNITIARWQGSGGSRHMNGSVGNVFVYNRALSASEILQNYHATKGRYGLA